MLFKDLVFVAKKNAQIFVGMFSENKYPFSATGGQDDKNTFWSDIAAKWSFVSSLVYWEQPPSPKVKIQACVSKDWQ